MKIKHAKIFDGRINVSKEIKKNTRNTCEMCSTIQNIQDIYCNHCQKSHYLCSKCIEENKEMLKMKPISIYTLFGNNLDKWK